MEELKFTVKACRTNKGYTKEQMAKHLGLTVRQYQDRENGITKWEVADAMRFSSIVGVPLGNIDW